MGDGDGNFSEFLEDDKFLAGTGADKASTYLRKVYPGFIHDTNVQRREYKDFAKALFKGL